MSIGKLNESDPNPEGFADRLRYLMGGEGLSLRALAQRASVSHQAIDNWLKGKSRASLDEVAKVASVFGWTTSELYDGQPRFGVMTTLARLESFRARTMRVAGALLADAEGSRFAAESEIPAAIASEVEDEATPKRKGRGAR